MLNDNEKKEKIKQEVEKFENLFVKEEEEIIILSGSYSSGAGRAGNEELWRASQNFIAYIDCKTKKITKIEDRVEWLADESQKENWIHNFKSKSIYKLKVRRKKSEIINAIPTFEHRFMLLEVLERELYQENLSEILKEYEKPIIIIDEQYGNFELNKALKIFEGKSQWIKENVSIYLDADNNNSKKSVNTIAVLHKIMNYKEIWDKKLREFAAEELVGLANDWLEDDDENDCPQKITKLSFSKRIIISELVIHSDGSFEAYYDDDDMFWGHIILITANINGNLISANIAG